MVTSCRPRKIKDAPVQEPHLPTLNLRQQQPPPSLLRALTALGVPDLLVPHALPLLARDVQHRLAPVQQRDRLALRQPVEARVPSSSRADLNHPAARPLDQPLPHAQDAPQSLVQGRFRVKRCREAGIVIDCCNI